MKNPILYLLTLLPLSLGACMPNLSSESGIERVKLKDSEVYFKREIRGLSYDVLVLSLSDTLCEMPDRRKDYVFQEQGPLRIYYKVENDVLNIYGTGRAQPPEVNLFKVNIVQHQLSVLEFDRLVKDAASLQLHLLEVPVSQNRKCR